MAKTVTFSGISKSDQSALFCIEPDWWDARELKSSTNFNWTKSNETGSYADEETDISLAEAQSLHDLFKPRILEKIAYNIECREAARLRTDEYASKVLKDYTKYVNNLQKAVAAIDSALGQDARNFTHFHLTISDWDSGY